MLKSLTSVLYRRRRVTLLLALAVLVIAGLAAGGLSTKLTKGLDDYEDPSGGNVAAREVIEKATGIDVQQGYAVLVRTTAEVRPGTAPPAEVAAAVTLLRERPEVRQVVDYSNSPALISKDGLSTVVLGRVGPMTDTAATEAEAALQNRIADDPTLRGKADLGGATPAYTQLTKITLDDLGAAESVAIPILLLLLFLVFRGLVAALLPMLGGIFAIMLTMLGMRGMAELTHMSIGGINLAVALGLGLSIDFSLLIVSRYREELGHHATPLETLRRTMSTAGRTVAFSSLTVVSALATLLVFPQAYLRSMGVAGMFTVVSAAIFALLVLPALLAALGEKVNALAPKRWQHKEKANGRWYRLANAVIRRGALVATGSVVILALLASPLLGAKFDGVTPSDLPPDASAGKVAHALQTDFAEPPIGPLQIVAEASTGELADYRQAVAGVPGVRAISEPVALDAGHWEIDAVVAGNEDTVRAVQALPRSFPAEFTGETADLLAQSDSIADALPIAVAILIVLTLLLLFAFTGSALLPVLALALNTLSVGAALGVLVWAFQYGNLDGFLSFTSVAALEEKAPILLFALAFGLSTDYNLFLLGRVKEARDSVEFRLRGKKYVGGGFSDREAVAVGIERTGRMVTSAAVLFCIAIGALAFSRVFQIQQLGFGTTFAVLLDATIIRALLVPALLGLLGGAAWWAPGPLRRLHTKFGLDRIDREIPSHTRPEQEVVTSGKASL